jgi:DNA uptake protein ComE-like DNA-binding protein
MPTPSEQKALAFVAVVIVLGGAVRVLRAGAPATASPAEQQAIARQAYAADSASVRDTKAKRGRNGARLPQERRDTGVKGWLSLRGYPPPSPRIDIDNRLPGGMVVVGGRAGAAGLLGPVDLDVAGAAEIEALPRIGPALAARIVASRDSSGPFGSLEALRRVPGIGPAMLRQLRPLVTFSGRAASSDVRTRY